VHIVRNRARELVDLLSDVDNIRTERRKAKANRHKYIGTGNDSMSFTSGGSRFGGFGSDSFSSGSGGYYGDRMSGRDGESLVGLLSRTIICSRCVRLRRQLWFQR
jgi:epsin